MAKHTSKLGLTVSLTLALTLFGNLEATRAGGLETAVQGEPLAAFPDTGLFTRIHPTKMTMGPDRKIYFNSSLASVYRVDEDGFLEVVSILPNAGGIPDDDFTIGITFDTVGNLFVSNTTGVYRISKRDLRPSLLSEPVPSKKVVDIPPELLFPMGLVADARGDLYLADIFGGAIFKIDVRRKEILPWFSDPALLAPEIVPSNNLFGIGFGVTDITIGNGGKHLYFGTQETHRIYRLGIDPEGNAGELEELAHIPNLAFNGISFDRVAKKIYLAVPWEHFENGIQVSEDPVEIGGSIWMIDVRQLEATGIANPVEILKDVSLGTPVDVVSGFRFGSAPRHASRLFVSDGSFDTSFWPNGDPNGTPLPLDPDPEGGVPFPANPYHGAIRMIELPN